MIDETVEEIEAMRTHSSSTVAIKAAEALRELLDREFATAEEYLQSLEQNSNALRRANTSHASLFTTQREIVGRVRAGEYGSVDAARAATDEAIDAVVADVERAKHEAAKAAVDVLEDGSTILTHDFSSTVMEAIELAAQGGHHLDVYVTEARPRFIGRKAVRTLAGINRVEPTLVVDSAVGHYLDECDRVVVGMDCIVDDTLYNRVGTFPIAATAAELAVPVSVLGSSAKLIDEGFAFENEFRSSSEVMREPADGFDVANPAYDATPTHLLDDVVTDDGVHEPE
ncbi:initiation factor 2B [Halobacteriales archaeon QS_1_68_44]|nr:MAG: initiation factor 2B [Halobacteriales archaeon QS_1_68_44]